MIRGAAALYLLILSAFIMVAASYAPHLHCYHGCDDHGYIISNNNHHGESIHLHAVHDQYNSSTPPSSCSNNQNNSSEEHDENNCGSCKLKQAITLPASQFTLKIKYSQTLTQPFINSILTNKKAVEELSFTSSEWNYPPPVWLPELTCKSLAKGLRAPPAHRA